MHSLHVQIPDTLSIHLTLQHRLPLSSTIDPSVKRTSTASSSSAPSQKEKKAGGLTFAVGEYNRVDFSKIRSRAPTPELLVGLEYTHRIYNIHEIAKHILAGLSHMDVLWFGVIWWFLGLRISWCTNLEQGCPYVETTILSESNACGFVNSPERLDTCERSLCFLWGMNRETP